MDEGEGAARPLLSFGSLLGSRMIAEKEFLKLVKRLDREQAPRLLQAGLVGLEKENLRVSPSGGLSQKPHPEKLGSSLTHPWITTDYSEAMLELITPPLASVRESLEFLCDLHVHVYQRLGDEILWATSMPCILAGETNIPIAEYGTSNAGMMKHLYRVGLGHRYGKVMQVISGVHFNYSVAESFWPLYAELLGENESARSFTDRSYMGMVRNLQRFGWLIPYLFGASPAVCKTFFGDQAPTDLQTFDKGTFYQPFATSLRMSDIGYQNQKEESVGIKANYDDIDSYVGSLKNAISTAAPLWEKIGLKDNAGNYKQLNTNILQIENEYYSTVRPKQVPDGLEKPVDALRDRGIRYVELRSLDVNAFHPLGIDATQIHFLEALMLYCLFMASPRLDQQERIEIDHNLLQTAWRGRDPQLRLTHHGVETTVRDWGERILSGVYAVAEMLDRDTGRNSYADAVKGQLEKISNPDLTPSAMMLEEMRRLEEPFFGFAQAQSMEHLEYFKSREINRERQQAFEKLVAESLEAQRRMEAEPQESFEDFLNTYFGVEQNKVPL